MKKAMRMLLILTAVTLVLCPGCAGKPAETELPFPTGHSAEYRNGAGELLVVCTLTALTIKPGDEGKQDFVTAALLFENKSGTSLMRISCDSNFIAADGTIIENAACYCDYHKNPMQSGETREYHVSRWIYDGERVADIALGITKAVTIEEEPMLPEPKTGELLFDFSQREDISAFAEVFYDEPPVKAVIFMDSWNLAEVEITDPGDIAAIFEAMKQIRVEKESNEYVTDNYNNIAFIMADGSELRFGFNRYNLEYDGIVYELSGDGELWSLLKGLVGEE